MFSIVFSPLYSDSAVSEKLFYEIFASWHRAHRPARPLDAAVDFEGIFWSSWSHRNVLTLTQKCRSLPHNPKYFKALALCCKTAFFTVMKSFCLSLPWGPFEGKWVANGKPPFYISWLRPWKTQCWGNGVLELVQFNFRACAGGNNWLPPWFTFCRGPGEHSPRQEAEFAYHWKRDSSSLGNPAPQHSICPENLCRGNDWCLSKSVPLRPEELLFSQEQLEDTW